MNAAAAPPASEVVLIDFAGEMEFSDAGSQRWNRVYETNRVFHVGDRGRTGPRSRATLQLSDLSFLRLGERTEFLVEPIPDEDHSVAMQLRRGLAWLFHRDRARSALFRAGITTAATRGTEFAIAVDEEGGVQLTVLEGVGELSNPSGTLRLFPNQQGLARPGVPPRQTSLLEFAGAVQWCLYYPGVLDPNELTLGPEEQQALASSLTAYRAGDLLRALSEYPPGRSPATAAERLYLAALLLSVGSVDPALAELDQVDGAEGGLRELADALRILIRAVKSAGAPQRGVASAPSNSRGATFHLSQSYVWQAAGQLDEALAEARAAVTNSPAFGLGWARVAELEFSHGRIGRARAALERSLVLAPRNAQAVALRGFLLAAGGDVKAAQQAFSDAIARDGALANAWLGRGLCRIRRGHLEEGRRDLEVAVALEPNRAILRCYLGKAWSLVGDDARAANELALAKQLDPGDPTSWFYSGLLLQPQNRINEAVRELEESAARNENRRVYRSALLLDQDRAARGANLAGVYRDAGMNDVGMREAARAVSADYANYSAHLFLSDAYNELRDPNQIDLRYETAWLSEYLMANLLAPAAAGTLAQPLSEQEYGRLFAQDRIGLSSRTEYSSGGDWRHAAVQHGLFGRTAYAVETGYWSRHGTRPNNGLEQLAFNLRLKHELTPHDSLFFQGGYYDAEGGDVTPYYRQDFANRTVRVHETQEPSLLAGYHHEWSPGMHTLVLVGRLQDTLRVTNGAMQTFLIAPVTPSAGLVGSVFYSQRYRDELELYSTEGQQIFQAGGQALVLGARFQSGDFQVRNRQFDGFYSLGTPPGTNQDLDLNFQRVSAYAYENWQALPSLLLVGGLSYDRIVAPDNFRYGPLSTRERAREQVSPKAGLVWTPAPATTLRAAYARSLGGVSLDQSYRLEPSQVAGFNQAYRSLIPEAVAGSIGSAPMDVYGVSLEQKVGSGTYLNVAGEWLESDVTRTIGAVNVVSPFFNPQFNFGQTREHLEFQERGLVLTAHQLVGRDWSLGGRYRLSQATLKDRFVDVPSTYNGASGVQVRSQLESVLHQVSLFGVWNHPAGWFAQGEATTWMQSNQGYSPDQPGDSLWQFNVWGGYRFPGRRAEIRLGLLNLTDQDYRLNPLVVTPELARHRTLTALLKVDF